MRPCVNGFSVHSKILFTSLIACSMIAFTADVVSAANLEGKSYSYVQTEQENKDVTLYEITSKTQDVSYTSASGQQETVNYDVKAATPQYYRIDKQSDYTNNRTLIWDDSSNREVNNTTFVGNEKNNGWQDNGGVNEGGALSIINSQVSSVIADFIDNRTKWDSSQGGALFLKSARLGRVEGDFIKNYAYTNKEGGTWYYAKGGAIALTNASVISEVTSNFVENNVVGSTGYTYGGAIANMESTIKKIKGDFIGNSVTVSGADNGLIYSDEDVHVGGGAIYNVQYNGNSATIGDIDNPDSIAIEGNFIKNYVDNTNTNYAEGATQTAGGAIYNNSMIGNIKGDFIENYALGNNNNVEGGAIANSGTIANIEGDFVGNSVSDNSPDGNVDTYAQGGAIYNNWNAVIGNIKSSFIGNFASTIMKQAKGGAIFNADGSKIGNVSGVFAQNSAKTEQGTLAQGGAIANLNNSQIADISGNFISNSVSAKDSAQGGAIANDATIGKVSGIFVNNSAKAEEKAAGGAIYNTGEFKEISGKFYNNTVSAADAKGGAIYTASNLNIAARDGEQTEFAGNKTISDGKTSNEAIYVDNLAVVTLETENNGSIVMKDNINGSEGYTINIKGDDTGSMYLAGDILNANVELNNTYLTLQKESLLDTSFVTLNSGTLSTINNQVGILNPQSLTVLGNVNMLVDVDLAGEEMDRFVTHGNYGEHTGNIIVSGMNLLTDAKKNHTEIFFAEEGLKDYVQSGVGELPDGKYQTTVLAPIYKYTVAYDNREDGGYFMFDTGDISESSKPSNPSNNFNPAVLASPVAAQIGGQSAINDTLRYSFMHADRFSQMPYADRIAYFYKDQYAITETPCAYSSGLNVAGEGYWVKPYTSFEKINLHNGPDVSAITYGTLIGFDGDVKRLKNDWHKVRSVFAGYNGSSMNYSGVDTVTNGGMLGLTETFYKNKFYTALTASAGATIGSSSTMYGNEDFTMLLAGIASKTGYNFEFKDGKYILQPLLYMSYSFVNTFDYKNAAGVDIDSTPLHTFQINPSLKFITNLENGWQPYASVGMVWNALNTSRVKANDVALPHMSVDPYVEYGVGVQKSWKDRITGFAQAMVRNGGRNGVVLTFGFRWAIGKDSEDL